MLEGKFFDIKNIEQVDESYFVKLNLLSTYAGYKGHFPDMPVAPGVCLTQMAKEVLQKIVERKLLLSDGLNIKFLKVVNPNETPEMNMEVKYSITEEGTFKASSILKVKEDKYFSITAIFATK